MKTIQLALVLSGACLAADVVGAADFHLFNEGNSKRDPVTVEECVAALEDGKMVPLQTAPSSTVNSRLSVFYKGAFYEFVTPDLADGMRVSRTRLTPKGL